MPDYVKQYDQLLVKSLDAIETEITALIKIVDRSKTAQEKMAYLTANRLKIIERIRMAGKTSFEGASAGAYKEAFSASETFFNQTGINVPFLDTDLEAFKYVRTKALTELMAHANIDGVNLYQELLNYSLTGNRQALEKGLLGNLPKWKISRYGGTITNTSISTFGRTVTGTKALRAGINKFEYAGPPPERMWCMNVGVGTVLTKEQIDGLPVAPGSMDPFYACGGWNCKHRWVPVVAGL